MSVKRVEAGSEGDEAAAAWSAWHDRGDPLQLSPGSARSVVAAIASAVDAFGALNLKGAPFAHRQAAAIALESLKRAQNTIEAALKSAPAE